MKTLFPKFKREKRSKTPLALALLLAPPLAYSLFVLVLFLLDSFRGDGFLLYQYLFESRRQVMIQLLADARPGLALFYGAAFLLWLQAYWLARYGLRNIILTVSVTGSLAAMALAAVFTGITVGSLLPALVGALGLSVALSWTVARTVSA